MAPNANFGHGGIGTLRPSGGRGGGAICFRMSLTSRKMSTFAGDQENVLIIKVI